MPDFKKLATGFNAAVRAADAEASALQKMKGAVPYDKLIGTREQIRSVIQNDADALAKALRDRGLTVDVHHSGSVAGPSSYLHVADESVGRFFNKPFRLSNHSKGAFESSGVIDVRSANEFEDVISKALALRDLGKSEGLLQRERMQQQADIATRNYWQGVAARAEQKQGLGQSLSNRERKALEWIEKNKDFSVPKGSLAPEPFQEPLGGPEGFQGGGRVGLVKKAAETMQKDKIMNMNSTKFGPLVSLKMNSGGQKPPGGKVNLARRSLIGLKNTLTPPKANPIDPHLAKQLENPLPIENLPAVVPDPQPKSSPLAKLVENLAEIPISRRDVLKNAASAALNRLWPWQIAARVSKVIEDVQLPSAVDEAATAKIADYVGNIWGDPTAAHKAWTLAHGPDWKIREPDEWGKNPSIEDLPLLWADIETGNPKNLSKVLKGIGLDLETVAKKTGLSLDVVKKIAGEEGDLLGEVIGSSSKRTLLDGILEDGRPKEARRETSYNDLFEDEKFMDQTAKNALKELGPDVDEMTLMEYVDDALQKRWREIEREEDLREVTPLQRRISSKIIDEDTLDNVWSQATDDDNHIDLLHEYFEQYARKHGWSWKGD